MDRPLLKIDLITLFPAMVEGFFCESMLGRAQKHGLIDINIHNLRDWGLGKHKTTDDRPFGGGAGMLLRPEPLCAAIEHCYTPGAEVIYMCPDGELLNSPIGQNLATKQHLIFISGHYEGIDQRVRDKWVTREISIGDYVLTNGSVAAAVTIDALCRYVPGVLGEEKSLTQDSFTDNLLTFPQFTRPAEYQGMKVPEVLLSGDHGAIEKWRKQTQVQKTIQRRPDLQ